MAQAAPIVIKDGQSTPVDVTFSPESVTPAVSVFADRATGISSAFRRLSIFTSFAGSKSTVNKTKVAVEMPITAVVNGVVTVVSIARYQGQFILPEGLTEAQRKDIYALAQNSLAHALVRAALRDLDPCY